MQRLSRSGDKLGTQPPVTPCNQSHEKTRTPHEVRENATFAEVVGILENAQVAEEGLELPPENMRKTGFSDQSGAKSGASGAQNDPLTAWLNTCPVDLDEIRQKAIRAVIGG